MFCAISGEPPATPVISKKSGLVYEQRLIHKYISENGRDPVTGDELTEEDLVEVKLNPKTAAPRPPTLSSVPSLLSSLQNEYDSVMLELFTLKKAYDNVRQELAHALYANDSANRVVARLMWERDEARSALASINASIGQGSATTSAAAAAAAATTSAQDAEMADAASTGLPAPVLAKIEDSSKQLSSTRKAKLKRKPENYPQASSAATFAQTESLPSMHGTKPPGVTALDVSNDGALLVTGGRDKQVQVYNRTTGKIAATLKGHTKEITSVAFAQSTIGLEHGSNPTESSNPPYVISASVDSTVRICKATDEGKSAYALAHTINDFKGAVTGIAIHPSGDLVAAASKDGSIALYDVASGSRLLLAETSHDFASLDFHPDGVLLAAGTVAGRVVVFDVRNLTESAAFECEAGSDTAVGAVSFSENGYLLASSTGLQVEIWDLRKLSKTGLIQLEGESSSADYAIRFDPSAQLLAVTLGTEVRVYANKTWEQLWSSGKEAHSANITAARWTWADGTLITAGIDRTVRTFGAQAQ